jgi:hypothetical protein
MLWGNVDYHGVGQGKELLELTQIGILIDTLLQCASIPFVVSSPFNPQVHFPSGNEVLLRAMFGVFGHSRT